MTGIAVVDDVSGEVVFAANLEHRGGDIKKRLDDRRAVRRSRRHRKTRYRAARFNRKNKKKGWLPPSLQSRISNVTTWVNRLRRFCPITAMSMELVKFDMQKMENPEISHVEYQQGTLQGYEAREYLLQKWKRHCCYCGKKEVPLQIEHIHPRAYGGTDRLSNLTLSCEKCNLAKGHGRRQMCLMGKRGFPRTGPKGAKYVKGFQTGDIIRAVVTKGTKIGTYVGRVAVRATGSFNITTKQATIEGIDHRYCTPLHKCDGYSYGHGIPIPPRKERLFHPHA